MKDSLISIIVPVYNVEQYLRKCIDSLVNQTYTNLEIILVDDGSIDNSGAICDSYAKMDKRIKVIHKDNGGLSDARNVGIKNSMGEYVALVDSDDYVENNYISELYNQIKKNNTNMAVSQISIVNGKNNKRKKCEKYFDEVLTNKECLKRLLLEDNFSVSANAKLYSKQLFEKIEYPVGRLYEDNGTTYKLILECDKISVSNQKNYNYIIRKNSITNTVFSLKKLDYILLTDEACRNIVKQYPELEAFCQVRKAVVRMSIIRQMVCSDLDSSSECEYKKILEYLKKNYKGIKDNEYATKKLKISLFLLFFNRKIFKMGALLYEKIK